MLLFTGSAVQGWVFLQNPRRSLNPRNSDDVPKSGFACSGSTLQNHSLITNLCVIIRGASRSSTPRRDPRNLDRADISISAPLFARNLRWGTYMYVRGSITVHTSIYVPYVCSYVVLTWSRPTISSKILDLDPRSRVKSRLSRMWDDLVSSRSRRVILDLVSILPRGTRRDRDAPLNISDDFG